MNEKPHGPLIRVMKRLFFPAAGFKAREVAVAFAVASFMNKNGTCYPGEKTIGKRAGLSERQTREALKILCDGPHPLFSRNFGAPGKKRRSYLYQFVNDLVAFVAARDANRAARSAGEDESRLLDRRIPPAKTSLSNATLDRRDPPPTPARSAGYTGEIRPGRRSLKTVIEDGESSLTASATPTRGKPPNRGQDLSIARETRGEAEDSDFRDGGKEFVNVIGKILREGKRQRKRTRTDFRPIVSERK